MYTKRAIVQKKQLQKLLKLVKEYFEFYQYRPTRAIDIGGADGLLGAALKNAYPWLYVLNVDKDDELIKEGLERFDNIEHLCADFFELNMPSVFDVVVSSNTFHWFGKRWEEGVRKVYDLLEEGGWFFLHQGGRWTYHFLYTLAEECIKEITGQTIRHTDHLYYPTLREFKEKLSQHFVVLDAFSKIELSEDYSLEELVKSFIPAGARVFTDRLSEEKKEEFQALLIKRAEEEDLPVFGRRLYAVCRKRIKPYIKRASVDEVVGLLRTHEHEFVPPLSQRTSAGEDFSEQSSLEEYIKSLKEGQVLVAKKGGEVIGFIAYRKQMLHFTRYPVCYITTLIVDKPYRRTGVAEALYEELLKTERDVYVRTWSTNREHLLLLQKLGFEEVYRIKDHRGKGIDSVYWRRKQ
ncbi:MAG: GNAT family N-acetyltransferase [Nitrososphaerales archaeon]